MVRMTLWAAFWTPHVSQPECYDNMHKGMCTNNYTVPVEQKHIKKSAFPEQHSTVLTTKDLRTCIFKVVVLQTTLPSPITNGLILCDTGSSVLGIQGGGFQEAHTEFLFAFPIDSIQICVLNAGQVG